MCHKGVRADPTRAALPLDRLARPALPPSTLPVAVAGARPLPLALMVGRALLSADPILLARRLDSTLANRQRRLPVLDAGRLLSSRPSDLSALLA